MTTYTASEYKIARVRECPVTTPTDAPSGILAYHAANIATADWYAPEREQLVTILLTTKLQAMGHHLISIGTVNETAAHPREILRAAVIGAAHGFILVHNHPSGDPSPSAADRSCTDRVRQAADLLQIAMIDHVIVGDGTNGRCPYFSFREAGMV